MENQKEKKSIVLILSTGRTGTKFFEYYINSSSKRAECSHEPSPSRCFRVISNLYQKGKIKKEIVLKIYQAFRTRKIEKSRKLYIESNNFMFGCADALEDKYNLKILHIVRNPVTYVQSHLNHGFWKGIKKLFVKYFPYWLEVKKKKKFNDPIQLLTNRWKYINDIISSYEKKFEYLLVKFEDIFSKNIDTSIETHNLVRDFFNLEKLEDMEIQKYVEKRINTAKVHDDVNLLTHSNILKIKKLCRKEIKDYQY